MVVLCKGVAPLTLDPHQRVQWLHDIHLQQSRHLLQLHNIADKV